MYPNRDTFEYLYPAWDTTACAQSMMESPVAGGRKSSLPVFTFAKKYSLSCINNNMIFEEDSEKKNPSPRWDLNLRPSVI